MVPSGEWRCALVSVPTIPHPHRCRAPGLAEAVTSLPPAGGPCWPRPRTSHCSSKTQSPSASSTSLSKQSGSHLPQDPPCLLPCLTSPTPARSNALETWDPTYFKYCHYEPQLSPYCPVFRIGDLVAEAGGNFEDLALLVGPELGARFPEGSGRGSWAHPPVEQLCAMCRVALWASGFTGIATWTLGTPAAGLTTPSSCRRGATTSGAAPLLPVPSCCAHRPLPVAVRTDHTQAQPSGYSTGVRGAPRSRRELFSTPHPPAQAPSCSPKS